MEVALQFSESRAAEVTLQHSLFCSADVILTKSCASTGKESALQLGKTKTLQTVTLRVAILSDFSARRLSQNFGAKLKQKSAQVRAVFSWKFTGTELSLAVLPFAVFLQLSQCNIEKAAVQESGLYWVGTASGPFVENSFRPSP